MRLRIHRFGRWFTLFGIVLALVLVPQVALGQVSIDPTATPEKHTGGWVFWMAQASIAMGVLVVLVAGASYLRFAPRFARSAREDESKRTGVPAPSPTAVRIQYQPPPQPVQPAPAPAAETPPATAETAPAPAAQAEPAAAPPADAPAKPAAPAAPRYEGPVELDQETFDRVLKEQLDKGTDRRVAEGRARSAAVKAAREKAGG